MFFALCSMFFAPSSSVQPEEVDHVPTRLFVDHELQEGDPAPGKDHALDARRKVAHILAVALAQVGDMDEVVGWLRLVLHLAVDRVLANNMDDYGARHMLLTVMG